jgi:predicted amidophosphoribosyltransferase
MRNHRQPLDYLFAGVLCDQCQAAAGAEGDGEAIATRLVLPHRVPPELVGTHALCPACLDLRRLGDRHEARCKLGRANLSLTSGGWATPVSEALRRALRRPSPHATAVLGNILASALRRHAGSADIVVPVPLASARAKLDPLLRLSQEICQRLGLTVIPVVTRLKEQCTRASVARQREQIVIEEYRIAPDLAAPLAGARVLLVDDNVTTGATLCGIATLLRAAGVKLVVPVTVDRTISPRLRQRVAESVALPCIHLQQQEPGDRTAGPIQAHDVR